MSERKFIFGRALSLIALVFAAAALFHFAAIVFPSLGLGGDVPPWRHAIFVAVNASVAAGLLVELRSRALRTTFHALFAILCVQQLASHGADAWRAWTQEHRVDVASLGVLVVMPLTLILLLRAPPPESR